MRSCRPRCRELQSNKALSWYLIRELERKNIVINCTRLFEIVCQLCLLQFVWFVSQYQAIVLSSSRKTARERNLERIWVHDTRGVLYLSHKEIEQRYSRVIFANLERNLLVAYLLSKYAVCERSIGHCVG